MRLRIGRASERFAAGWRGFLGLKVWDATTLRMLMGLLQPDRGRAENLGQSILRAMRIDPFLNIPLLLVDCVHTLVSNLEIFSL